MEVGTERHVRERSANKLICAQESSIDLKLHIFQLQMKFLYCHHVTGENDIISQTCYF